jgi:hypothetical protein
MKPMAPKLPPRLAKLPTMTFTRTPAPQGPNSRSDVAYDIQSTDDLVKEFEKREARIRGVK